MILIISSKSDIHCNPVIDCLRKWQVPFFRVNTDSLLGDYEFSYQLFSGKPEFFIKNRHNKKCVNLSEVYSVWERRPTSPICEDIEDSNIRKVVAEELKELSWWLRSYGNIKKRLGHHSDDRLNENKLRQLNLAQAISESVEPQVLVPETLISNDLSKAFSFIENFADSQRFAVKPISADGLLFDKQSEMVFWTQAVTKSALIGHLKNSNPFCPAFIQPYIEKRSELRVTVVGDHVFTCEIDSQSLQPSEGREDWRKAFKTRVDGCFISTPTCIKNFVLQFNLASGSNFGCFDFIVTPRGEYFFLECNPNGQWMWLEEDYGAPISRAIATFLTSENYHVSIPQ